MAAGRALLLGLLLAALADARSSYAQAEASNNSNLSNFNLSNLSDYNVTSNSTEDNPLLYPFSLLFPPNRTNSSSNDTAVPVETEPEMVIPTAPKNSLLSKKVNAAQLKIKDQAKVACQNVSTMKAWAACMQTKVADMTVTAGNAIKGTNGQHLAVIRTNNADGVDDEGSLGHSQAPASSKVRSKFAKLVSQRGSLSLKANAYMMQETGETARAAMAKEIALLPANKKIHPKAPAAPVAITKPAPPLGANATVDVKPVEQPEPEPAPVSWFAPAAEEAKQVQQKVNVTKVPCDTKDRKALAAEELDNMAAGGAGGDLTSSLSSLGGLMHSMEDKMKSSMEETPLMHTRVEHVLSAGEEAMPDADRNRMQASLNKHVSEQRDHIDNERSELSGSRDRKMFAAMASATQFETNANKTVARAAEAKNEVRETAAALTKAVDATVMESEAELAAAVKEMRADEDAVSATQRNTHAGIQSILRDVELARKKQGSGIQNKTNTTSF